METLYRKEQILNIVDRCFHMYASDYRNDARIYATEMLEEIPDNSQIQKLEAEKAELQQWKYSALEVMNQINLQEVGKVLNLQLGSSVSEQILPSIKKLVADKTELLEALEKVKPLIDCFVTNHDEIESLIQKMKQ